MHGDRQHHVFRVNSSVYPSASSSAVTSCGNRSSLVTEKALNCPASARAICRSVSLSTTPVSVTCPRFTTMWIDGFALAA